MGTVSHSKPIGSRLIGSTLAIRLLAAPARADGPAHVWSRSFGGTDGDAAESVAFDPDGNVLMTGQFSGSADLGGTSPLISQGQYDIYVAKYDADGNHLWSQGFGSARWDRCFSIASDGEGNVLVTGDFKETIDFGGGPLVSAGDYDGFVAKFDADGNHVWSHRFGDLDRDRGMGVSTDDAGNVLLTGWFLGAIDLGGGILVSAGSTDAFVAKYDADGLHVWSQRYGNADDDGGTDTATDAAGNVFVTGVFRDAVEFGGAPLVSAGGSDMFVAKYDASGTHVWSKGFGGSDNDNPNRIATDASGNALFTGYFGGTVDFGGGALFARGPGNVFVVELEGDTGSHVWSRGYGWENADWGAGIATDAAGNVFVTGAFFGSVDCGGGEIFGAGQYDVFVAQYDTNGAHLWSQAFGGSESESGSDLATDASGNVIVAGNFVGSVDFGGGVLASMGSIDIFLARFGEETIGVPVLSHQRPLLGPAHPNPFRPSTTIQVALPEAGPATVRVFDVRGRLVRTLLDAHLGAGPHTVSWDGRDAHGRVLSAGVYVYRLDVGDHSLSRKLTRID